MAHKESVETHVVFFTTGHRSGMPTLMCTIGERNLYGASFRFERELKNVVPGLGGRILADEVDLSYPVLITAAQLIDAGFDSDQIRNAIDESKLAAISESDQD